MNDLLNHRNICENQGLYMPNIVIVDCRFDYEYQGGHIKGAININSKEALEETFFEAKDTIENIMRQKPIIIFHCEFS